MEKQVKGDRIDTMTTIDKFKKIMNELIRGYPAYLYFGIFEHHFGEEIGRKVINFLEEDGLIVVVRNRGDQDRYRVTPQGIAFATAMAQLEYAQRMEAFTRVIIYIGGMALIIALEQLLTIWGIIH